MKQISKILMMLVVVVGFLLSQPNCLKLDVTLDRQEIRAGETVTLTADISIEKGFHIYSVHPEMSLSPTAIEHADSSLFEKVGIVTEPAPHMKFDTNFDQIIGSHYGDFVLKQQIIISRLLEAGQYEFEGTLSYLACDATRCIPKWDDFTFEVDIHNGDPRSEYVSTITVEYPPANIEEPEQTASGANALDEAINKGFFSFLLLAISMGLLSLLTPCVFPMIPITVSFFTRQGELEGSNPIKSAAIYALGIVFIYSAIGMILSLTLGASGANQIAANPWVNLFIAILFLVFTLSLFGMFELQLPNVVRQYSVNQEQKGGSLGILFMALTFTVTSFTCTVQFVGLLLVAASQGDFLWPLIGMIAFSSALALPFFFLALFPQYLAKLPKSGGWLNSIKVVMGFFIFAAAFKFLGNIDAIWHWGIFSRQLVLSIWVVLALLLGFYLLGKIRLPHDSPLEVISVPRFIFSIIVLAFSLYLGTGLFGKPLNGTLETYLPMDTAVTHESGKSSPNNLHNLSWMDDLEEAFIIAKEENKPVFVDFTGKTCTNCRWMEKNVLSDPKVFDKLDEFVLVHLFTDMGENARKNQNLEAERFGTVALPFYVILSENDEEIARFPGLDRDVSKFVTFLEKGLN